MRKTERGMSLAELTVAIAMLAVGMSALLILFLGTTTSSRRNRVDTSSTLLAEMILDQISSQDPGINTPVSITDCQNNVLTVDTADNNGAPGGTGANLDTNTASPTYGLIDQTQAFSTISAGYAATYTDCDTQGHQNTYEIRWNVMTITANYTKLITVSARQSGLSSNILGGAQFAIPVTLRGVAGK